MDIQSRKIEFVQAFLKLQSEEVISQFESLLKKKSTTNVEQDSKFNPPLRKVSRLCGIFLNPLRKVSRLCGIFLTFNFHYNPLTGVWQNCEFCSKFTFISRKKFYL
jgi:hypothetical protein